MSDVLVIDDDDVLRLTVALLLRSAGHTPHEFSSGSQALRALESGSLSPTAVLLDLHFEEAGDGAAQFLRALRAGAHGAVPVYLVSGHHALAEQAAALGAEGYIAKPFEPRALLAILQGLARPSPAH